MTALCEWDEPWGEDCDLFVTAGHVEISGAAQLLHLARAVDLYVGEGSDVVSTLRDATCHHAWVITAPPESEWWGDAVASWDAQPDDPPTGWRWAGRHDHGGTWCWWDDDCPEALCLGLSEWCSGAALFAAAMAPASVQWIAMGDGWPILCRIDDAEGDRGAITVVDIG